VYTIRRANSKVASKHLIVMDIFPINYNESLRKKKFRSPPSHHLNRPLFIVSITYAINAYFDQIWQLLFSLYRITGCDILNDCKLYRLTKLYQLQSVYFATPINGCHADSITESFVTHYRSNSADTQRQDHSAWVTRLIGNYV
jgi:hypothetical protein